MGSGERADRILLYYLDRYCYRCYSSIRYHVFERQEVLKRKGDIEARLTELQDATLWMPQDRMFPGLAQTEGVATPDEATSSSSSISWSNCNNRDRTYPTIAPARLDHVSPWRTTWYSASIHRSA